MNTDPTSSDSLSSDEIALRYVEQLPWPPYPFQEQAIFSWFGPEDGLLVCAPTGTGKTVIAETALYEALSLGKRAYYTTPLIALTEQKFRELQEAAERWGFSSEDIGLVTGTRRVNPEAPILVVVAEVLLNRLLAPEEFDFSDVSAVVMDEFHSFNDPERGIVWELTLSLLPQHARLLLISATVGNAVEFVMWLKQQHGKHLRLLQSTERRVPLEFRWVPDQLLTEQLELMADGTETVRYTPALVFCFNRAECWSVAEQLRGKALLGEGAQKALQTALSCMDWTVGAGGKLKQLLMRGVGIHHAGLLPRYRRAVESLFQQKLLTVCVCTETLSAGINLPARSVVMTSLLKGPPRLRKLVDANAAHQMFGRAGRPQFDDRGYVYCVAHEDDVRIFRWQEKYDAIPEDTKDPLVRRAKKNMKKKMPRRRDGEQYWSEKQFEQLQHAAPARLTSRGRFPWRLLAYLIRQTGTVAALESAVRRRLLDSDERDDALKRLKRMLITLDAAEIIRLQPPPPNRSTTDDGDTENSADNSGFQSRPAGKSLLVDVTDGVREDDPVAWTSRRTAAETDTEAPEVTDFSAGTMAADDFGEGLFEEDHQKSEGDQHNAATPAASGDKGSPEDGSASQSSDKGDTEAEPAKPGLLGRLIAEAKEGDGTAGISLSVPKSARSSQLGSQRGRDSGLLSTWDEYQPEYATAGPTMELMSVFRSVNPILALYTADLMHRAGRDEQLQLMEALLVMTGSVASMVRVPFPDEMPHGPLALTYADGELLERGLATQEEINGYRDEDTGRRIPPMKLARKIELLFRSDFPGVTDARMTPVWCVGGLLEFEGKFDRFVRARDLTKQEGIIFRHCLRMIMLCGEFAMIEPPGIDPDVWRSDLHDLAVQLTISCRTVDPDSTDETLTQIRRRREEPDEWV